MTNLNILLPLYNDWKSCNILIKKINEQLRKKKRFGNILILDDELTVENGFLTPKMSVKRNKVIEKYIDQIDKLYLKE